MIQMEAEVYKTYRVFGKSIQRMTEKEAAERIKQLAAAECG